jgi:hypothetical protein
MKDFEETRALDRDALHALLSLGDPRDRVLAIWALALRSAAAGTVLDLLRVEPDPGVRRALAVVLAGAGEIDLVVAMTRHDPSVHVRASTVQMVVRFAAAGRVPWSIVGAAFDDVAEVRASVVSQIDVSAPAEVHEAALACLRDPDEVVRHQAFESCAKLVNAGVVSGAPLCEALDRASADECSNALAIWFAIESPDVLGSLLVSTRSAVRETALRMKPDLARSSLAALVAADHELFARLERSLGLRICDASLKLVLELAAAHAWRQDLLVEATSRLEQLDRAPADLVPLLSALRVECQHHRKSVELSAAQGELESYDDDDEPWDWSVYDAILEQLGRLL